MAEAPGPGLRRGLGMLLAALPGRRRRQLAGLTLLTVAGAAAELLVVAGGLQFLSALAGGSQTARLPVPLPEGAGPPGMAASAALFAAGVMLSNLVKLALLRFTERFVAGITHELTVDIQRRVLAQPYDYHVRHHSSELIASLEKVQLVASSLVQQWLQTVAAAVTGLAMLALLASIDAVPALAAFAGLGLLYWGIARLAQAKLRANARALSRAYGERIRKVQESLGAIRDLKLDHAEAAQVADFAQANARFAEAQASNGFLYGAPRLLVEAGAVLLVAGLAAWLAERGGSEAALMLVGGVALAGLRLLPLLQAAYRNWAVLRGNRGLVDDIAGLLALPAGAVGEKADEPLPFRQSIRLQDVTFRYPERPEAALSDVSLEIRRGDRVAVSGETGSGKSTLADLVMGLLRPGHGTIAIDGQPLDAAGLRAWQRNIAHVAQSIFLLDASIARNIAFSRPGEPMDMDRVRAAAEQAELAGFVAGLPQGYDTEVGERGVRLSGGQRQRIGIARALYKGSPVLVLDEATNALDEATEDKLLANLFADEGRTILLIAHRPSAVRKCRAVIRLVNGRVAAPA